MSYTTGIADLRTKLSDGPKDRLRAHKAPIGIQNGVNKNFKTFEFRRITTFVGATGRLGVFVNGVAATVASDDFSDTGEFTLSTAPVNGDRIECTYFVQWFTDAELTTFLTEAGYWMSLVDYTTLDVHLIPALLNYAAGAAYLKYAIRWAERMSEVFRTEDSPDAEILKLAAEYRKSSDALYKQAERIRNDFYTRQGQSLQPAYATAFGSVRDVVPRR